MAQSQLGQRPRLLLQGGSSPLRLSPFEVITLLVVLALTAYIGYTLYARFTDLNAVPPAAPTYLPAFRTTLTSSVSATGSVQATQQVTLTFASTGKIKEFLVKLGDVVKAGQPLARIDDSDLQQTLRSANSSLASAQARYAAAVKPPAETDTTSALQSIASANAQVSTAQTNLDDLLAGPKAADISTAQQGIITATTALQSANDAIPKAQNDIVKAQTDVVTAQTAVTTAQTAVTTAQRNVDIAKDNLTTAKAAVTTAKADVSTAQTSLSSARSTLSIYHSDLEDAEDACGSSYSVPSMPSGSSLARTALPLSASFSCSTAATPTAATPEKTALDAAISKYNSAANSYNTALSTVTTRENAVTTAEKAVTTAENAVTTAENGVTTAQNGVVTAQNGVTNAQTAVVAAQNALNNGNLQRAVQNAQLNLTAANQKLTDTLAGPKSTAIEAAQRSLDSANASLASAQARYDALFDPPAADVLLPLQAAVDQAAATVETARKNLEGATIVAPFDGQISSITGEVGSQVSASTTVFVLLNPRLIRIDANVDQADVSNLKSGQTATVTFDALAGRSFQATVTAIGLSPTTQQGVVTYVVTLGIDTSRLPAETVLPSPGMTAAISVTTSRAENVVVVPSRAVRRVGRTSTVTVKTATGSEPRTVTTGATNGTLVQVVSGLNEGEEILVSAPRTTTTTGTTGNTQTGGFQGGGGGFPTGGGGGAGPVIIQR